MRRLITTALALAALTFAQEAKPVEAKPRVQKIFQLKYANACGLVRVLMPIASVQCEDRLRLLTADGTAEAIAAIEDALKRLDTPPEPTRNVELIFHMILARPAKDGSLPADLQAVQRNLETLFGFKGFQLIETAVMRTRDGTPADTSGAASFATEPKVSGAPASTYQIHAQPAVSALDKGYLVRIDNLRLNLRVAYPSNTTIGVSGPGIQPVTQTQFQFREVGLSTNIDVRDGQKVVVGKSNVDGSDGAVILVVTAKVVE